MDATIQPAAPLQLPGPDKLPEELRGPTPRTLPEFARASRLASKQLNIFLGCLVAGGLCLVLAPMPFVKTMALYFLPLGYLMWIGIGLCAIGAIVYAGGGEFKRACRYLREGEAAFARVESMEKRPTVVVHGQPSSYALFAKVQLRHPDTGDPCLREVKSRDFTSSKKDRVKTRFRVGDAVPVVWMPHKFDKTLTIYDFLDISPDARLLSDPGKPTPLYQVVGLVVFCVSFFFALFWNLYALERFQPLDVTFWQGFWPFAIGAVAGVAILIACYVAAVRKSRQVAQRNQEALATGEAVEVTMKRKPLRKVGFGIVLALGAALLGGLTTLCWAWTANALLDSSPRQPVPVRITDMIQETTDYVFRQYKMKYRRADDNEDRSLLTTPDHLDRFQLRFGIAQIRQGRFGWPWVETIDPVLMNQK